VGCHQRANQFSGGQATKEWENPLQDLFESYVSNLYKLRESFHVDLTSTRGAVAGDGRLLPAQRGALTSFMDKVASRGVAAAAARLDQFRGLSAIRGLPNVNDGPLALTPSTVC
jgi:hypothetical protein